MATPTVLSPGVEFAYRLERFINDNWAGDEPPRVTWITRCDDDAAGFHECERCELDVFGVTFGDASDD